MLHHFAVLVSLSFNLRLKSESRYILLATELAVLLRTVTFPSILNVPA